MFHRPTKVMARPNFSLQPRFNGVPPLPVAELNREISCEVPMKTQGLFVLFVVLVLPAGTSDAADWKPLNGTYAVTPKNYYLRETDLGVSANKLCRKHSFSDAGSDLWHSNSAGSISRTRTS